MNTPDTCFECSKGRYVEIIENCRLPLPNGESVIVPELLILRCDKCGAECFPPASSRKIDNFLKNSLRLSKTLI